MSFTPVDTHHTASGTRELPRVLGLTNVMGILVGTVIGSGIFIVPAAMAGYVQSPVLLLAVWVVGGLLTFFGALPFSELGAAYPAGRRHVRLPARGYGKPTGVPVRLDAVPRDRLGRHRHPVDGVCLEVPAAVHRARCRASARRRSRPAHRGAGRHQLRRDPIGARGCRTC